tara:strand:+ start:456 stop:761 length:306 start_codon:yes stop_codon:yes gene_type:complete
MHIQKATYVDVYNSTVKVIDEQGKEFFVPVVAGNGEWRHVQQWADDGGVIGPFVAEVKETEEEQIESRMSRDPMLRAMINRAARAEAKTPRQVMDELKAEV